MEKIPKNAKEFWESFKYEPAGPGLQKILSSAVFTEARKALVAEVIDNKVEKARLMAIATDYSGSWITLTPVHYLMR